MDAQQELADCSLQRGWEHHLSKVPHPSWGTELLYTLLGVAGALSPPS